MSVMYRIKYSVGISLICVRETNPRIVTIADAMRRNSFNYVAVSHGIDYSTDGKPQIGWQVFNNINDGELRIGWQAFNKHIHANADDFPMHIALTPVVRLTNYRTGEYFYDAGIMEVARRFFWKPGTPIMSGVSATVDKTASVDTGYYFLEPVAKNYTISNFNALELNQAAHVTLPKHYALAGVEFFTFHDYGFGEYAICPEL